MLFVSYLLALPSPRPQQPSPQAKTVQSPTPAPKQAQPVPQTKALTEQEKEQPATDNVHLLAIQSFGLTKLKKTVTNDRSAPKL
jgi:hypothetical protein